MRFYAQRSLFLFIFIYSIIFSNTANATVVEYSLENIGFNRYQYNYSIINDVFGASIEELAIFFSYGLFENISVETSPVGWDSLAINPDMILGYPEDGFVDTLSIISGLTYGERLDGLSVSFDWLGAAEGPSAQAFAVIDPLTYSTIESSITTPAPLHAPVPEPATMFLLGTGLLGIFGFRRGKRR